MRKVREPIPTKRVIRRAGKGLHIGYLRVSAVDQRELRQLEGLELDKTFTDKASGKDTKRPNLELLLSFIREGDTLGACPSKSKSLFLATRNCGLSKGSPQDMDAESITRTHS
jgi:hypothetical protein